MRAVLLGLLLASASAGAEPEGYRGGEGRPPGTTYVPPEGPSVTVRGVMVDRGRSCGAGPAVKGSEDLVTVTLAIANPTRRPIPGALANMDLVVEGSIVEGTCVQNPPAADLGARQRRTVQARFLVPRGAVPKILVYNDDDFPALFALPRARRR